MKRPVPAVVAKNRWVIRFCPLWLFLVIVTSCVLATGEETVAPRWQTLDLPFRVLGVASSGTSLWTCGTDEAIAASTDGGAHWQLKHQTLGGNLLLTIGFTDDKFGYAAGSGGILLITEDGGQTWVAHSAGSATVLLASFADPRTGLIRTPGALLFTVDGGANWSTVSAGANAEALKSFPYSFALAALDSDHMAVMLKSGAAQYESQEFLTTSDRGKSWKAVSIPNVTLYSFLRTQGRYWAVGTEVIDKDKPGGGHGVPVVLSSSDGEQWSHSINDLSACGPEMCVACTSQGCLSANGTITNVFADKTTYWTFPSNPKLTPEWASSGSSICFIGATLYCASATQATKPDRGDGTVPPMIGPGPLGANPSQGPHCIACEFDHFLVDQKVQGAFSIKLVLDIARNGSVSAVEVDGAPSPEIKSRIEQQAQ